VVYLGAVPPAGGSGLASFLPVPVNGRKLSRHGKGRLRMSHGNENVVTCHGAFYKRRAKSVTKGESG